ncbi:hypothetical protein BC938DRAFT_477354 [Jimgerdemannia flammicorona]|uniref:Uncharacterized protein n=1 Tax=Jimgerdemannia flammicorona TaxID=994334 RepID=A0A433QPG5_9FUNG|nr:hypothetical protein BC938DRAFT_477354 [Jimgerdemannia flammicorona]
MTCDVNPQNFLLASYTPGLLPYPTGLLPYPTGLLPYPTGLLPYPTGLLPPYPPTCAKTTFGDTMFNAKSFLQDNLDSITFPTFYTEFRTQLTSHQFAYRSYVQALETQISDVKKTAIVKQKLQEFRVRRYVFPFPFYPFEHKLIVLQKKAWKSSSSCQTFWSDVPPRYDQENNVSNTASGSGNIDGGEPGEILAKEVSEYSVTDKLEGIWNSMTHDLKKRDLNMQAVCSRIVDLSNRKLIEWRRVLSDADHTELVYKHRRCLRHDLVSEEIMAMVKTANLSSLSGLRGLQHELENTSSNEGLLAGQLVSTLIEKEVHAVTDRKRRMIHAEFTHLNNDMRLTDMLLELRSFNLEVVTVEVGNMEKSHDDTKERVDKSALTIQLKDMLDAFVYRINFTKEELKDVCTIGMQIEKNDWVIYVMTFDASSKFYFMCEVARIVLPTTLAAMSVLLPQLMSILLALRHTLLELDGIVTRIVQYRTISQPPSSPLAQTIPTPVTRKTKEPDPFAFLDSYQKRKRDSSPTLKRDSSPPRKRDSSPPRKRDSSPPRKRDSSPPPTDTVVSTRGKSMRIEQNISAVKQLGQERGRGRGQGMGRGGRAKVVRIWRV